MEYYQIDKITIKFGNFSKNVFYNINFPSCHPDMIKGLKITRQSNAFFNDKYQKIRSNLLGKNKFGYKLFGEKVDIESSDIYDSRALLNGWITITPLSFQSTAMNEYRKLKKLFL